VFNHQAADGQSNWNLYWKSADGTGAEERLTKSANLQQPLFVTRNGMLVFQEEAPGTTGHDLWILPLQGERTPKPLRQTRTNEYLASLVMPPGAKQPPMTFSVKRGDAYVGFELVRLFGMQAGDKIEIFGVPFRVARCLSQTGSSDDIRIYGHLHDVQAALGLPGRINEIKALECLCLIESGKTHLDALTLAQRQLEEILPETKVVFQQDIADARQKQRAAMEGFLTWIMPVVLVACGVWIGLLAKLNVRQRLGEIGILCGLGYGSGKIALLVLGRSVIIGLAGALLGFAGGTALALYLGSGIFELTARAIEPDYSWLLWMIVAAPGLAAVSSLIPTVSAATCDPGVALGRE